MRRAVLDTNVYVSAYGFGGKPAAVVRAAILGEYALLTSVPILTETADKLYTVLGFDDEHVAGVLRQLGRVATVIAPELRIDAIDDDPDNRVLECAVSGEADVIVSGDRHLLDLRSFRDIPIARVADFLTAIDTGD